MLPAKNCPPAKLIVPVEPVPPSAIELASIRLPGRLLIKIVPLSPPGAPFLSPTMT